MSFQTTTSLVYVEPARNAAKFYEVEVAWAARENEGHGAWIVTRRWGRIGTHGQESSVAFDHGADAAAHADSLLAAKLRKGYQRVDRRIPPDLATAAANGTLDLDRAESAAGFGRPSVFDAQPDVFANRPWEGPLPGGDPDVLALQAEINRLLVANGYPQIHEDGKMGPRTQEALGLLRSLGLVLRDADSKLQDILDALMAVDVEATFTL